MGVMDREEALFRATQQKRDLIEIAPKAKPPVCKIIDFNKFRYQENKKEAISRKKSKGALTKEVRFTPFIAKNDFETRIKKTEGFLKEGHKVRLTVKFMGRQMGKKQFGYNLLKQATESLKTIAKIELEPRLQGYLLMTILSPTKIKNA